MITIERTDREELKKTNYMQKPNCRNKSRSFFLKKARSFYKIPKGFFNYT